MSKISRSIAAANELDTVDAGILAANDIEIEDDVDEEVMSSWGRFLSRVPLLRRLVGRDVPDIPALIGGSVIALAVFFGLLGVVSVCENIVDRRVPSTALGLLIVFFAVIAVVIFFAASSGVQRYLDERKAQKSSST